MLIPSPLFAPNPSPNSAQLGNFSSRLLWDRKREEEGERRQRLHASQLYAPPIFLSVVKGGKYFWHLRHSEILLRTAYGGRVWDEGVYLQRAKESHKLGRRMHLYLMSLRWVGRPVPSPRRRDGSATWAERQRKRQVVYGLGWMEVACPETTQAANGFYQPP